MGFPTQGLFVGVLVADPFSARAWASGEFLQLAPTANNQQPFCDQSSMLVKSTVARTK
jgi:hypothetical protein